MRKLLNASNENSKFLYLNNDYNNDDSMRMMMIIATNFEDILLFQETLFQENTSINTLYSDS